MPFPERPSMTKSLRFEILRTDGPSRGGRIYPNEIVEEINRRMAEGNVHIVLDSPWRLDAKGGVDLARLVGGIRNPLIENNVLSAEIEILDTPCGIIARQLIEAEIPMDLCTSGIGMVDKDGTVSDYKLSCCFLATKGKGNECSSTQ